VAALTAVTMIKNHADLATALTVSDPMGLASGGLQFLAQTMGYNRYIRRDWLVNWFATKNRTFSQQNERKIYIDTRAELLAQAERLIRWSPFEIGYVSLREALNVANGLSDDPFRWGFVIGTAMMGTISQGLYEIACNNECEVKIEAAGVNLYAVHTAVEVKKWCFVLGSFISVLSMGLSLANPVLGGTGFFTLFALGIWTLVRVYGQKTPVKKRKYKTISRIRTYGEPDVVVKGIVEVSDSQPYLSSWNSSQAGSAEEVTVTILRNQ
jgi:hypothetical protein